MAYNPDARILAFEPINKNEINYYMVVVDIPNSWDITGEFEEGVLDEGGTLTFTCKSDFPSVEEGHPGDLFSSYAMPAFTKQTGDVKAVIIQGKNKDGGVKKTGIISNKAPIQKWTRPAEADSPAATIFTPLQLRTFVITNESNPPYGFGFFIGAFCLAPVGEGLSNRGSLIVVNTPTSTNLQFNFNKVTHGTAKNEVAAFEYMQSTIDQYGAIYAVYGSLSGNSDSFDYRNPDGSI